MPTKRPQQASQFGLLFVRCGLLRSLFVLTADLVDVLDIRGVFHLVYQKLARRILPYSDATLNKIILPPFLPLKTGLDLRSALLSDLTRSQTTKQEVIYVPRYEGYGLSCLFEHPKTRVALQLRKTYGKQKTVHSLKPLNWCFYLAIASFHRSWKTHGFTDLICWDQVQLS